ncbi:MAG: LytR family transcriptional regulator [Chloroflexi bacterium]|nr:MAG: LytR family transcriptional regulator [Chloroflexota bacterium]
MQTDFQKRKVRSGIRLPLWALGAIGMVILIVVVVSSVWLFGQVREMASTWEISNPDLVVAVDTPVPGAPVVVINGETAETDNPDPLPILSAEAFHPWEGQDRISILLLGVDQRCDESGPTHTDSLMLLTIDPVGLSAAMMSLPRDLWVEIPGFGVDRINQAYYYGQVYEYPGGGPVLAVETVEAFLGVPIDYYVAVNFEAFINVVDTIGGIEIDVPEAISDPTYPDQCYGYDPFYIEAGHQTLDGATALKYARTRATLGGDVDRAARQQAVILAVRDRVLSLGMLPQLVRQAPQLWQTLQANVRTNMTLDEAVQLALLAQDIPRENITTAVIDYNYVYNETTPDGRQVLVPLRSKIRELRDELFAPPAVPTPVIENLPALMATEKARVAVYNGTAVFGLAAATQSYLQQFNINVTEIGNADSATYPTTQIIDYGSHPYTTQYLTQLMHVRPLNISTGRNPAGDFDILVIIGNDWRVPGQE